MYGKIVGDKFYRAPRKMPEEEALALGYKPVELAPAPDVDENHTAVEWLEDTEANIVRHWNIVEITPDPELDDAEALSILLGGAV